VKRPITLLTAIALVAAFAAPAGAAPVQIGSKKFTESVLLGEMVRQLVAASGHAVSGTGVSWAAPASFGAHWPRATSTPIRSTQAL
jgi:glycine betaine/choline ABC-type transport system substrate-binding protein